MINVIIVFPKLENAKHIRSLLMRSGIEVTALCTTGAQALQAIEECEDGIIVCGYRFPDMLCDELREYLPTTFEMVVIASSARYMDIKTDDIVYLSMPMKVYDLLETMNMLIDSLRRKRKKRRAKPRQRSKEEILIIDNAKELLEIQKGMTEEEAHRYLQKTSMDNGTNLVETAQMVLRIFNYDENPVHQLE